jgi:dTDP-4-dehydrorhamnose 3,5-epimerase-like enzyme
MGRPPTERASVEATVLARSAPDPRGASFTLAPDQLSFLGEPRDAHVASILPGHVRGEHYHAERRELILVIHEDEFSLHWDEGPGTEARHRMFAGAGAVAIAIEPGAAHALRNDGARTLWLLAASDLPYDPERPDAYRRTVVASSFTDR